MRCRTRAMLTMLTLVAMACRSSAAGPDTKPAEPTEAMMAPYRAMAETFKFSAEQSERLKAAVAAKQEAMTSYLGENGPAWKAAMEASGQAVDAAAKAEARATIDRLQAGLDRVVAEHEEKIAGLLTPGQRREWLQLVLRRKVVAVMTRVTTGHGPGGEMTAVAAPPDEATQRAIDKACSEAAEALLRGTGAFDPKAQEKAAAEIIRRFKPAGGGAEEQ